MRLKLVSLNRINVDLRKLSQESDMRHTRNLIYEFYIVFENLDESKLKIRDTARLKKVRQKIDQLTQQKIMKEKRRRKELIVSTRLYVGKVTARKSRNWCEFYFFRPTLET
jgi:hypothetical protein